NNAGKLLNPQSGFNSVNTDSWMWGMDLTLDQGLDLVSWWGQVDMFTYSYASVGDIKAIDDLLYSEIPSNDVRKDQFVFDNAYVFAPKDTAGFIGQPINKFFTPERQIQGQRDITTD